MANHAVQRGSWVARNIALSDRQLIKFQRLRQAELDRSAAYLDCGTYHGLGPILSIRVSVELPYYSNCTQYTRVIWMLGIPNTNHIQRTTRRDFLKFALGSAALAPLAGCDSLGLDKKEEAPFDGPTIDEEDFISFNAGYYGLGVDSASQLPFSFIRDGVPIRETDPVSIAFRLQHLLADSRRIDAVDTLLNHLLAAQIDERIAVAPGFPGGPAQIRTCALTHPAPPLGRAVAHDVSRSANRPAAVTDPSPVTRSIRRCVRYV